MPDLSNRIYDKALSPGEIVTLKSIWSPDQVKGVSSKEVEGSYFVYPNPSSGIVFAKNLDERVTGVESTDVTGRSIETSWSRDNGVIEIDFAGTVHGFNILKLQTVKGCVYRKVMAE